MPDATDSYAVVPNQFHSSSIYFWNRSLREHLVPRMIETVRAEIQTSSILIIETADDDRFKPT